MDLRLVIISPQILPNEFRLPLPITIGRSREAKVKLAHGQISRIHCELFESDGRLMIKDLGSLNGTFVNGSPINEVELMPEDELLVGSVTLKAVYQPIGGKKVKSTSSFEKKKITETVKVTETVESNYIDPLTTPGPEYTQTISSVPEDLMSDEPDFTVEESGDLSVDDELIIEEELQIDDDLSIDENYENPPPKKAPPKKSESVDDDDLQSWLTDLDEEDPDAPK